MRLFVSSCLTLILAAAIGLGATWLTLTRGVAFGSMRVGAWTAWPKTGSVDIDPYARATIARTSNCWARLMRAWGGISKARSSSSPRRPVELSGE